MFKKNRTQINTLNWFEIQRCAGQPIRHLILFCIILVAHQDLYEFHYLDVVKRIVTFMCRYTLSYGLDQHHVQGGLFCIPALVNPSCARLKHNRKYII